MFPNSQKNTSDVINLPINKLKDFDADLGETNIYTPIELVFQQTYREEYPRTVFLITDGQVEDTLSVVFLIKTNSGNSRRVHGFGIGYDLDRNLIKKAAKAGRGSSNFVSSMEDMDKTVIQVLKSCLLSCVNHLSNSWQGEAYPETENMGSVFYRERCAQYMIIEKLP